MKRIYGLLLVLVITHLPLSCGLHCDDSCCGDNFKEQYSKVAAINSEVGSYQSKAAIFIHVSDIELLEGSRTASSSTGFQFSFINRANACSPAPPNPTQKIESITITSEDTIYASGQIFAPGTEVTQLFYLSYNNNSIEEFIRKQNENAYLFGTYETSLMFQLEQQPDSTINQKLRFTFSFDDSSILETETEPFLAPVD